MWKAILGCEPGFHSLLDPALNTQTEDSFFGSIFYNGKNYHRQMAIVSENGSTGILCLQSQIIRISWVNPDNPDHISRLLVGSDFGHQNFRSTITYRVTVLDDVNGIDSIPPVVCSMCFSGNGGWSDAPFNLFLDLTFKECAAWFRNFEASVLRIYPEAQFSNHAGHCSDCFTALCFKEYKDRAGWGADFYCDGCYAARRHMDEFWKNQDLEQKQLLRQLGFLKTKVAVACTDCGQVTLKLPEKVSLSQSQIFCTKDCNIRYLKRLAEKNRVSLKCDRCEIQISRTRSNASRHGHFFCSDFCYQLYLAETASEKMIYFPDLLTAMSECCQEACSFPGCNEPKASYSPLTNRWNACKIHALRIYHSLRARSEAREKARNSLL